MLWEGLGTKGEAETSQEVRPIIQAREDGGIDVAIAKEGIGGIKDKFWDKSRQDVPKD